MCTATQFDLFDLGDTSGQVEPLLSSFDEPAPLTAIPANTLLNRLDEEESALFEEYDTDGETDADSHRRQQQEDEDAKIPLLTSPEVNHSNAIRIIHRANWEFILNCSRSCIVSIRFIAFEQNH